MNQKQLLFFIFIALYLSSHVNAQQKVNYQEKAIEPYILPELLICENGEKVKNIEAWKKRRLEILTLFKDQVYGRIPEGNLIPFSVKVIEQSDSALDNKAIRKQIAMVFKDEHHHLTINLLLYLPKHIVSPPVFIGYNFYGNQTIIDDSKIILTDSWIANNNEMGILNHQATEASRGKRNYRWPVKKIISEGFGLAVVYYGDIDPDKNDFSDGIHPFFYDQNQSKPTNNQWGSISAWAWGASKVLDYLKKDELLSQSKFIMFGHSRLGKTSLWAGALDHRFDMVISNNSGCGGAAIFRRKYGETVAVINENFPHWFNTNFKKFNNKENSLPVDQHMLIALMAPRPVYIASAADDQWADPKGEYLSGYHASPVYELFEKTGLKDSIPPALNHPIHNDIGYHIRKGKHDVTNYDWEQYMKFANQHFEH